MHVWNVLHVARWNTERKNYAKNRRLRTFAQLCRAISSQLLACIDNQKKLVKQHYSNISSTCSHNMVNFGPLTADIGSGVWCTTSKFQRVSLLASLIKANCKNNYNNRLLKSCPILPRSSLIFYFLVFSGFMARRYSAVYATAVFPSVPLSVCYKWVFCHDGLKRIIWRSAAWYSLGL